MSPRRVVVTGLGATTPVGGDVTATWVALTSGRSGVRALDVDWAEELPVRIAAPVAVEPAPLLEPVEVRRLDRVQQLALVAAREAWSDAGAPAVDPNGSRWRCPPAAAVSAASCARTRYCAARAGSAFRR
ncbi:hypothetical protein Psuf_005200 [Phytohabitans suffuscus]|uniref:Beta-ketoacyl synthase-like N-terminal domain-containing protein n=1 Tax=Phytohabitans suffuscus TaxID=624315 RepID=A0A6F8YAW4_9ACTN|nr:hypothetical protein Psuf_005200 [Phytohabitans suffuscus]